MAEDQLDDIAKVQEFMKEQVDSYMAEKYPTPAPQQSQKQESDQDIARRQVKEFVDPIIKPDLDEAKFTATDARDFVDFYTTETDAKEYKDEVEKLFKQAKDNGRPMPRKELLRYLRGREYESDPDKFVEKTQQRKKQQVEHAGQAVDFGAAALNKAKNDSQWTNFEKLSVEDMEKALDGITF